MLRDPGWDKGATEVSILSSIPAAQHCCFFVIIGTDRHSGQACAAPSHPRGFVRYRRLIDPPSVAASWIYLLLSQNGIRSPALASGYEAGRCSSFSRAQSDPDVPW